MTMNPHRILKSFKGSQNGVDSHEFEAGTVANLSDWLAEVAVKEGWAEPVDIQGDAPGDEALVPDDAATDLAAEAKAEEPAEENKALSAPENKSRGRKKQS